MIPKLKTRKQYIGRGFAVWDEKHEIARKHICTAIRVNMTLAKRRWSYSAPVALCLYSIRWCDVNDCYVNKVECMLANLSRLMADTVVNPEQHRHFEKLKESRPRKLALNRYNRKIRREQAKWTPNWRKK